MPGKKKSKRASKKSPRKKAARKKKKKPAAATRKKAAKKPPRPARKKKAAATAKTGTFAELLSSHPLATQALARTLRDLIRSVIPRAKETAYLGWCVAVYEDAGPVCGIGPAANRCHLYLNHGAHIEDPDGLLEGTGKGMRHVKVYVDRPVPAAALKRLVRADLAYARSQN